jgi:phosphoglycolate phosphatase
MRSSERPIRGVLLDKDGTILDYWRTWLPVNREVALFTAGGDPRLAARLLRAGGHDPDTDLVAPGTPFAAGSVEEIATCLVEALDGRPAPRNIEAEIDRIFQHGGARYSVLIEGAREALSALKQRGLVLGLATNDTIGGLVASLTPHDVLDRFAFRAGCDSGHGAKPGPGMVQAFAAAAGMDPGQIAVVGDSTHDLEMAAAAGAGLSIAVLGGTGLRADLAAADVIVDSIRDVPDVPELGRVDC